LQFAQFVDLGRPWNAKSRPGPSNTNPLDDRDTLASVGLGLRWSILPRDRARFELYWGLPLNHITHSTGNLQDHGIHLQLIVQVL
jgi:hemolysin activation/secretion protein